MKQNYGLQSHRTALTNLVETTFLPYFSNSCLNRRPRSIYLVHKQSHQSLTKIWWCQDLLKYSSKIVITLISTAIRWRRKTLTSLNSRIFTLILMYLHRVVAVITKINHQWIAWCQMNVSQFHQVLLYSTMAKVQL